MSDMLLDNGLTGVIVMKGCIHIYTGDGKGKTTAATGLAVRFAGDGGRVLFSQMLKDGKSGEISVLDQIEGIDVDSCTECFGFSFAMSEETRQKAIETYTAYLGRILERAVSESYGLLILDEIIAAYNLSFIDREMLIHFLDEKPQELEVVMTGRNPAPELLERADYVSEIRKIKHPYDQGILARKGIEF